MRWLRFLALSIGALALAGLALALLWVSLKLAQHGQEDDELHMAEKQRYLESLGELPGGLAARDAGPGRPDKRMTPPPNIVFILFDDLGYGDLGITGSQAIATPTMDRLARDGVILTNFYSPAPVCTPARAGYLTGRFPLRAGMPNVVFPTGSALGTVSMLGDHNKRIPAEEITLADVLGAAGYATGMVGKWHLGDRSPSLPNDMGFQEYFGALYSNDMTPFALYRNREIEIEAPADQTRLNEWYGNAAIDFIDKHREQPFFLYFAHNFPHIPLYRPAEDEGRSSAGLYGDVIEGLDDVVERIVTALKSAGIYENTLILITSDNGPWYQGSPADNRGRKADTFEGGMHVPMIVHWPSRLEGGRELDGISMGTDWFPTILDWLELPLPADRLIDGKSLRTMLEDGAPSPNEHIYYFTGERLMAVRDARYKYHDERPIIYVQPDTAVSAGPRKGPWLFDMALDYNESYDVSMLLPGEAQRLGKVLAAKREEMKENKRGWIEQP